LLLWRRIRPSIFQSFSNEHPERHFLSLPSGGWIIDGSKICAFDPNDHRLGRNLSHIKEDPILTAFRHTVEFGDEIIIAPGIKALSIFQAPHDLWQLFRKLVSLGAEACIWCFHADMYILVLN
jgi:hypothetical protein